jgi:membrane associated rhomboid family serine protease
MTYTTNRFGPAYTPTIIKALIGIIGGIGLVAALLFSFNIWGPQNIFSMSQPLFIWQPMTYWTVQNISSGISFNFIIGLLFNMYLVWIVGSTLVEKLGDKRFLHFFLLNTIGAGFVAGVTITLTGYPLPFAGPEPIIYAMLMLWMLFDPEQEMLLLLTFPIKIKWLVSIFLGITLFLDLTHGHWPQLAAYLTTLSGTYLYWKTSHQIKNKTAKIYDFKKEKKRIEDAKFMDEMLAKISEKGENVLSLKEKMRMQKISKRMKKYD